MESIFLTIIICTALIIIFNWWLSSRSNDFIYKNFMVIHKGGDKRTEALEQIQDDLDRVKEKLGLY